MDQELESFLMSRDVAADNLQKMKMDKIDRAVLNIMTDEEMAKYIPSYGNRLAVRSFCQIRETTGTTQEGVLDRLRQKIAERRTGKIKRSVGESFFMQKGDLMARHKNTNALRSTRRIEVGWLHYQNQEFHQVRSKNGGGTRHLALEKNTEIKEILEIAKNLFFPEGQSVKGSVEDFEFHMCDFKKQTVTMTATLLELYEQSKLKMLRLYLCSRELVHLVSDSSDAESHERDPKGSLQSGQQGQLGISNGATAVQSSKPGTADHSSSWQHRVADEVECQSPSRHSTPDAGHPPRPEHHNLAENMQFQSPVQLFTADAGMLPSPVTHNFADHVQFQLSPIQHSNTDTAGHLLASPCLSMTPDIPAIFLDINQGDFFVVREDSSEQEVFIGPQSGIASDNEETLPCTDHSVMNMLTPHEDSVVNSSPQPPSSEGSTANVETTYQGSVMDSSPQPPCSDGSTANVETTYQGSVMDSSPQPPSSEGSTANVETTPQLSIRRIKVVDDLLAAFMDSSTMNVTLKMEFVNERAIDDAGVSREVYTAFWEQFLELCEGETERVPRLRPDFHEAHWHAIGLIWAKGFLDHGVIPVRLSKAFIVACLFGINAVDNHTLLDSFFNYISSAERAAVEKALQGTMGEDNEEDLLDLFTRMGSHLLPSKTNLESAIKTMAHKAVLQEPKFIIDCFFSPMALTQIQLSDKEMVLSLYESKRATGKRVAQLFQTTNPVLSQREQTTYNHLQRFVKNTDQLKAEQILRYCTGSSVICVEKISVCFNAETGLSRRPIGHTCGATLELPSTYSSYPEFRTEFDNILSSGFLEMDIL